MAANYSKITKPRNKSNGHESLKKLPQKARRHIRDKDNEKHFLTLVKEQSKLTKVKLKYDLAKESLPYITALLMLIFTGLVYREALIGVAPTLFAWIIHSLKKRAERKDKDAD